MSLEGIERLNALQAKQEELFGKWKATRLAVGNKLYELLNELNQGPAKLFIPKGIEESGVRIKDYDWPQNPDIVWALSEEVYFKNQDPNRVRDTDFGSSFSLSINNLGIRVNHGSCGEWSMEDKGQWSRLLLIRNIFYHQEDIIRELNALIDINIYKEYNEAKSAISEINRAIEKAKREEEEKVVLSQLKAGKYLCKKGSRWVYDNDDENSLKGHYIYFYHQFSKIEKVSEVTLLTTDPSYYWISHRPKIKDIVRQILMGDLYLVDSKDATPQEESGSNSGATPLL